MRANTDEERVTDARGAHRWRSSKVCTSVGDRASCEGSHYPLLLRAADQRSWARTVYVVIDAMPGAELPLPADRTCISIPQVHDVGRPQQAEQRWTAAPGIARLRHRSGRSTADSIDASDPMDGNLNRDVHSMAVRPSIVTRFARPCPIGAAAGHDGHDDGPPPRRRAVSRFFEWIVWIRPWNQSSRVFFNLAMSTRTPGPIVADVVTLRM